MSDKPLTAEEQAMIDAAWQTHRDALKVPGQQPSDRPKTLLDGFGEATEQVVVLRAEVERLQALIAEREEIGTLEHAKQHISCGVVIASKDAEVERLRAEKERYDLTSYADRDREIERLRREIATWGQMWDDADLLEARVEALRNGTAILASDKAS
jgi:uncharacterized small protein (DUF1192 family)